MIKAKILGISFLMVTIFGSGSVTYSQEEKEKQELPKQEEKITREVLSEHDIVGRLIDFREVPCRFRTALCPDRCGHGRKTARFQVVKYLSYKKFGQYGDEQSQILELPINDNGAPDVLDPTFVEIISKLKSGDFVRIQWNHEYVSRMVGDRGSKSPERPVIGVEPLTIKDVKKLVPDYKDDKELNPKNPAPDQNPAPLIQPR